MVFYKSFHERCASIIFRIRNLQRFPSLAEKHVRCHFRHVGVRLNGCMGSMQTWISWDKWKLRLGVVII